MVLGQDFRLLLENAQAVQQKVPEIGGVEHLQPLLVVHIKGQQAAFGGDGVRLRDLVRPHPPVLPALDDGGQHAGRVFLVVHGVDFQELLDQPHLVVGIEDGEIGPQSHHLGMGAEDAGAQGMEGAEPPAFHRPAEQRRHPFPHLLGRPVGEGHGQDFARAGMALVQQMRQARRQHPRLAGAGAGQHQHRTVEGLDGLQLGFVEVIQVRKARGARAAGGCRRRVGQFKSVGHGDYIARGRRSFRG